MTFRTYLATELDCLIADKLKFDPSMVGKNFNFRHLKHLKLAAFEVFLIKKEQLKNFEPPLPKCLKTI